MSMEHAIFLNWLSTLLLETTSPDYWISPLFRSSLKILRRFILFFFIHKLIAMLNKFMYIIILIIIYCHAITKTNTIRHVTFFIIGINFTSQYFYIIFKDFFIVLTNQNNKLIAAHTNRNTFLFEYIS